MVDNDIGSARSRRNGSIASPDDGGDATGTAPDGSPAATVAPRGVRPLIWVPSLILLVLAILIVFSRG